MIKTALDYFKMKDNITEDDILLAAPTGKAAVRMSECIGFRAKTVHSHIFSQTSVIKVIVVDEVSMLDLIVAGKLLTKFVNPKFTKIIWMGDNCQVTPIGVGQLALDLVKYHQLLNISLVELNQVHRYGAHQGLQNLASHLRSIAAGRKEKKLLYQHTEEDQQSVHFESFLSEDDQLDSIIDP